MFKYVNAKNFKSFKDIKINFKKTKTKINKFVAIYGENGSGKTHIVELFKFLQKSISSRYTDAVLNQIPKELIKIHDIVTDKFPSQISSHIKESVDFNKYRMINEEEPTEIEYGFNMNGIDGYYYIKFNDKIIEEKLYYLVDKQRDILYEIKNNENNISFKINKNTFKNKKYNEELEETVKKYWGNYSFLSLLIYEMLEKNEEYIKNNIDNNMLLVINNILLMSVHVDSNMLSVYPDYLVKKRKLDNIQKGTIAKEKFNEIKVYENILNIFFTQAYADIKRVKYVIEETENKINYELFFEKMIGNDLKLIPSRLESDGTRRILEQFDTLVGALLGETVVIDEIDNGVHDVLIKNIIMSLKDEITGQLIITTHNTLLLEVLPRDSIYILSVDYNGKKTINSIKEYRTKVQKNNNLRDLYFKGLFGGIPQTEYIDFEEIKYTLEDSFLSKREKNE